MISLAHILYSFNFRNHIDTLYRHFRIRKLILLVTFLYTLTLLIVLLHRFWQYEAFYYDHGMMESSAYQVAHLKVPVVDRDGPKKLPIYADHFYPSLQLTLAPFYWLWDSYETPIIVLAILTGLSVYIGFSIARKYISNLLMIYALLFGFMFYIGLQNALIFFIHDITLQIFFLMLLFWSIAYRKEKLFYALLLFNLGFKESVSVTLFMLGVTLALFDRTWRKQGIVAIVLSVLYGLLAVKLIIPYFRYTYYGTWNFAYSPEPPKSLINYITYFFDTPAKRETIFTSLMSFGMLPVLSIGSILLIIQDFAQRFVLLTPTNPLRQGLNLHYNANLAVILFVGSLWAVRSLQKFSFYKRIITFHAIFIFATVIIYHRFIYHGPLGLIYNKDFFKITRNMKFMDEFIERIPRKGKLMVQNNLAVRFTHNDLSLLLNPNHIREIDPQTVVLDFRPGQNANNYWPMTAESMKNLAATLSADPQYGILYNEGERYIFRKKN